MEPPKITNENLRKLGRRLDINPSTITGWVQNGTPENVRKMVELILELEEENYWLKREISGTLR